MEFVRWALGALKMPGAASFRKYDRPVRNAGARKLDDSMVRAELDELRRKETLWSASDRARYLAVAREVARSTLGYVPFDEQLVACCALLDGHAVEMDTGEGKTLVGALAAAGHALQGRHVHLLSVNDYLAERDAAWMRPFYELLGIEVSWVGQHTKHAARREAYRSRIVYAPVSEIGFDVLRDRLALNRSDRVVPIFDAAIVDEADSVMVDEAVTPLVLAGTSEHRADDLTEATQLVKALTPDEHYTVAADGSTAVLTDAGLDFIETQLDRTNLYDTEHLPQLTRINLALHARALMHRDVDYLVVDGAIKLINTRRGRVAHMQRWPDGLHAAIEAKENLRASSPGVILDQVTVQDLLLHYRSLAGMSGTVTAVAEDLLEFYQLPSGRIERHAPNQRIDAPDRVFLTTTERNDAAAQEVATRHAAGQPVLIGTQSVSESEQLAELLELRGIEPRVLNAKNDADEALIIARAGAHGAVTISTQMSGRGTDIHLGGAAEKDADRVRALGGLAVLAVGRYPSRRLDAQLRGRSGRQGDPGTSIVFVSLEDELVRQHAMEHMLAAVHRQGDSMSTGERQRIVDTSQQIAEGIRRDQHRATWAYNRAIAAQRQTVLRYRENILDHPCEALHALHDRIPTRLRAGAEPDLKLVSTTRLVMLHYLDERWSDHLAMLQEIRDGIHLRALASQNPADEFHRIALREFHHFFDEVSAAALAFLRSIDADDLGSDLDDLGLRRPSATWTYMVTDDPFGSPADRLARALGRRWRSKVLKIE